MDNCGYFLITDAAEIPSNSMDNYMFQLLTGMLNDYAYGTKLIL